MSYPGRSLLLKAFGLLTLSLAVTSSVAVASSPPLERAGNSNADKSASVSEKRTDRARFESSEPLRQKARPGTEDKVAASVNATVDVPVTSASLRFSGTAGDSISQGLTYSYNHGIDTLALRERPWFGEPDLVLDVTGADGKRWSMWIDSGDTPLAVGRYEVSNNPASGMPTFEFWGDGRACGHQSGYFEIHQLTRTADGVVDKLDATFVQHCGWDEKVKFAYGHLLVNATTLRDTPLTLSSTVNGTGSTYSRRYPYGQVNQTAVAGTVGCTSPGLVRMSGEILQPVSGSPDLVEALITPPVSCSPAGSAPWQAATSGVKTTPFVPGSADAKLAIIAYDVYTITAVTSNVQQAVTLTDSERPSSVQIPVTSASFTVHGESSNYSYAYDLDRYSSPTNPIEVWSDRTSVYVHAKASNGDYHKFWIASAHLAKLKVGKYDNARRVFGIQDQATPGLDVSSADFGCDEVSGGFEVHQIAFAPDGNLAGIDVTFELGCSSRTRVGHLVLNMTPLRQSTVEVANVGVDAFARRTMYGVVTGANIVGTVRCSANVRLQIRGSLHQGSIEVPISGTVDCVAGQWTQWSGFGTTIATSGLTSDRSATMRVLLVAVDPYLRGDVVAPLYQSVSVTLREDHR